MIDMKHVGSIIAESLMGMSEHGSSVDLMAAGGNSILKDRISTLNQMLKQVKEEEEQLLKKIHTTSTVTPRNRSNESSRVLKKSQRLHSTSSSRATEQANLHRKRLSQSSILVEE